MRKGVKCVRILKSSYAKRPLGVSTLINAEAFPKQLYTERPSPKGGDLDKELMCEDLIYKPIRREP